MKTKRAHFERLGSFDERFAPDFNDADYCLRLRREGFRIVYNPDAELTYLESRSVGARIWDAQDLEAMPRCGEPCAISGWNLLVDFGSAPGAHTILVHAIDDRGARKDIGVVAVTAPH